LELAFLEQPLANAAALLLSHLAAGCMRIAWLWALRAFLALIRLALR
jgi:hypothetical protein